MRAGPADPGVVLAEHGERARTAGRAAPGTDAGHLSYAEALRALRAPFGERAAVTPLRLVSSATTSALATFLRAYAARRGQGWEIVVCDYGPLTVQLGALAVADTPLVVVVGVEDVFAELSYRADTEWTTASLTRALSASGERIQAAAARTRAALEPQHGRTVVVPPVADAPALPTSHRHLAARMGRLSSLIGHALGDQFEGTGVHVLDVNAALEALPRQRWRDDTLLVDTGSPLSTEATSLLASAIDRVLACAVGRRKVLVTDLDNTVWRGVLGEDGPAGVGSHPHGPQQVNRLWQRMLRLAAEEGMLLAVCSKNDPDVLEALADQQSRERAGLLLDWSEFAAISVNWQPKSVQIAALAARLGLPLDAFVLVDDDPVELAEVAAGAPEVLTLRFPADAAGLHDFALALQRVLVSDGAHGTEESRSRSRLYALRDQVETELSATGSTSEFLSELGMRASVEPVDQHTEPRARELLDRTNQFHLTGRRYDDQQWRRIRTDPELTGYIVRLTDRFGDHGICGLVLLRVTGDRTEMVEMAVSCRVFNRTLETAVLRWVADRFPLPLSARWRSTGRNQRVRDLLGAHGFHPEPTGDQEGEKLILTDSAALSDADCFVRTHPDGRQP
jgi:FkbH-like protein